MKDRMNKIYMKETNNDVGIFDESNCGMHKQFEIASNYRFTYINIYGVGETRNNGYFYHWYDKRKDKEPIFASEPCGTAKYGQYITTNYITDYYGKLLKHDVFVRQVSEILFKLLNAENPKLVDLIGHNVPIHIAGKLRSATTYKILLCYFDFNLAYECMSASELWLFHMLSCALYV